MWCFINNVLLCKQCHISAISIMSQSITERSMPGVRRQIATAHPAEWRTVLVAVAIYAGFGAITWFYDALPWWLVVLVGAYLVAWHGSLQHEAIHGHPTRRRWLNEMLVFPSLWLWLPYRVYHDTHIAHHREQRLTDPLEDPESYYTTAEQWRGYGCGRRGMLWICNTVTGRLLFGPLLAVWALWRHELPRLLRREQGAIRRWALHVPACAIVFVWVVAVCEIPLLEYIVLFAYPGTALTLLRSFAEHQAAADPQHRSVVVETAWPMALLYLNNNLHALHHREPGRPWYELPSRYREQRRAILAANGGYRFRGYAEIIARYLIWAKEAVVHPDSQSNTATGSVGRT
jgi:fatty acid desaturase